MEVVFEMKIVVLMIVEVLRRVGKKLMPYLQSALYYLPAMVLVWTASLTIWSSLNGNGAFNNEAAAEEQEAPEGGSDGGSTGSNFLTSEGLEAEPKLCISATLHPPCCSSLARHQIETADLTFFFNFYGKTSLFWALFKKETI